jgi:hypothetical protein
MAIIVVDEISARMISADVPAQSWDSLAKEFRFDFHCSGLCGAGFSRSRGLGRIHALPSDVCAVS